MQLAIALKSKQGLTFIELMIVSMILVATVAALVFAFIGALNQIALAKEISIASEDLSDVLEKMKSVSFADITTQFPDGVAINPNLISGFLLHDESIVVRYPQGIAVDPLEISVQATWTSRDARLRSQTFKTLRTRML